MHTLKSTSMHSPWQLTAGACRLCLSAAGEAAYETEEAAAETTYEAEPAAGGVLRTHFGTLQAAYMASPQCRNGSC
jgi:hypothetical protein